MEVIQNKHVLVKGASICSNMYPLYLVVQLQVLVT